MERIDHEEDPKSSSKSASRRGVVVIGASGGV